MRSPGERFPPNRGGEVTGRGRWPVEGRRRKYRAGTICQGSGREADRKVRRSQERSVEQRKKEEEGTTASGDMMAG